MPRKRTGRRRHTGGNIRDVLGKVNDFFKKHKLISRGASALAPFAGAYSPIVAGVGGVASKLGYGKKRRRRRPGRPRKMK
jgi:hypothetical protein